MKRFLFGFLAVLFLILNTIPYLHILADDMPTDSQYSQLGAIMLSSLITTGEATELDFSDYTDSDTDFLIALGELAFTGDPTGLVECGLNWLGGTLDDIYDSAIQSIREWEHDVAPDLYNWWYQGTEYEYKLQKAQNVADPLRKLLTPRQDGSTPTPNPDPTYDYLANINTIFYPNGQNYQALDYFNLSSIYKNTDGSLYFTFNPHDYSVTGFDVAHTTNHVSQQSLDVSCISPIVTINVDSSDPNNVIVSYSQYAYNTFSTNQYLFQFFQWNNVNYTYINSNSPAEYRQVSFVGINTAFNYIYQHFGNINLYVNGEPWYIVNNDSPSYPIVIPNQLTIWNSTPLCYDFPEDTFINIPDLTTLIRNAINQSDVVTWQDIDDYFVDINGVQALPIVQIYRNDYDNLYMEQYPYPAMLIGMTDQTKFNEHLLDDSHGYLSPINTVVQETVNILPPELVGVLVIGAILTIFAVIINRLLE